MDLSAMMEALRDAEMVCSSRMRNGSILASIEGTLFSK
jgi:hypothetical protein